MKSVDRLLHDLHATWMTLLSGPPQVCEEIEGGILLQPSGESSLDQSLEGKFYGSEEPLRRYKWGEVRLYDLKNVHLVGDQANVFLSDGRFLQLCPSLKSLGRGKIRRPIPSCGRKIEGLVFHLSGRNHENHGHFLSQHVTRLMAAREWLSLQGDYRILVAPKHAKWQGRYLNVLGFDTSRIIEASEGTLEVERLAYVPMWYDDSHLANPSIYREIADSFENFAGKLGVDTRKKGKVLFISRNDAPNKVLLNESEIIEICRGQLGEVEVLDLKAIPLEEQVRKFSQASWIIGPQGQGLTNVLFCSGSKVLILEAGRELGNNESWCLGYRDMALACGHAALRLHSGTDRDANLDWTYPGEKFKADLAKARQLIQA